MESPYQINTRNFAALDPKSIPSALVLDLICISISLSTFVQRWWIVTMEQKMGIALFHSPAVCTVEVQGRSVEMKCREGKVV